MQDNVNATPAEVRHLAKEIALGVKKLMELNDYVDSGLAQLSKSFQDEGFDEYRDSIKRIQGKLAKIADDELETAVKELVSFADLLESAQRA